MSNPKKSNGTNPFEPLIDAPVGTETDYHTDEDVFIIDYAEVDHVSMTGKKDTEFVITKEVEETSRIDRQEYIDSFRDDVGILNIIEKVRLSGDVTLLNQTGRVSMPGNEKDALGRPVEDVADYTNYQVDKIEALESYKKGIQSANSLKNVDYFADLDFKELAKLSDDEINAYLSNVKSKIEASKKEGDK